ncbi:MAG: hypothetical protein U5L95_00655 [Candidatus Saccharibacteria bacterium]|nr:hypothetical protein [Candidatus Saccharibacteria bacterium]
MNHLERDAESQERKLAMDRFMAFGGAALLMGGVYIDSVPAALAGALVATVGAVKSVLDS